MDARLRPWSMWVDAHAHRARSVAAIDCDRLKAKTEMAAGDATLPLAFWRHTFDRGRWDNKHAPAWPKYRHADRLARHIKHEAAFVGSPQAQVKFDPRIDLAATKRPPGSGGPRHHAKRSGGRALLGTHSCDQHAWSDDRRRKLNGPELGAVNPQHCDVGRGVTSDQLRRNGLPPKGNGELAFLRQGFVGGYD